MYSTGSRTHSDTSYQKTKYWKRIGLTHFKLKFMYLLSLRTLYAYALKGRALLQQSKLR